MPKHIIGLLLVGASLTLLSAPVAAEPPAEAGHPPPDEVFENRLSLFPCPDVAYVGEDEPFTVVHGWALTGEERVAAGRYRFELWLNGEKLMPTFYNAVAPGQDGIFPIIRRFAFDFADGLVSGDVLDARWYDPNGLALDCTTTIMNGDPPA
jgi:hypothetical protein